MASDVLNRAALVSGPIAVADSTGATGVMRYATSASTQSVAVPAAMQGCWIKVQAVTLQVDWAFSTGAAATLVLNQASVLGTGHASSGDTLQSGSTDQVLVPKPRDGKPVYLNFISSGTTGFFVFRKAETPAQ